MPPGTRQWSIYPRTELGVFICFPHPCTRSRERKAICRFQVPGHHIRLHSCSWVIPALLIGKLGTSSQEIKAFVPKENSWPDLCNSHRDTSRKRCDGQVWLHQVRQTLPFLTTWPCDEAFWYVQSLWVTSDKQSIVFTDILAKSHHLCHLLISTQY